MLPMTMEPPPGSLLISMISLTLHSKWIGLSITRGGLTASDGTRLKPANSNSLNSDGASMDEAFIARSVSSVTMFTTNSFVVRTLFNVSLVIPSVLRMRGQNRSVGGLEQTALKNENGARFARPLRSRVEIQPIGLGTIEPVIIL